MEINSTYKVNAISNADLANRARQAVNLIEDCGSYRGEHHKQWILDQVVRLLLVTDRNYEAWVEAQNGEWEEGIAPPPTTMA